MLKGFHHVALNCSDLDRSVAFYRDLLGLKEITRSVSPSGARVVALEAGGGKLELFSAEEPASTPAAETPRSAAGFRHFALLVDDVDAAYGRLSAAGVMFTVLPRDARVFPDIARLAFCQDPDGILVELMQPKP